jgi:hypothetical protein
MRLWECGVHDYYARLVRAVLPTVPKARFGKRDGLETPFPSDASVDHNSNPQEWHHGR